jgi:hypothetical protein
MDKGADGRIYCTQTDTPFSGIPKTFATLWVSSHYSTDQNFLSHDFAEIFTRLGIPEWSELDAAVTYGAREPMETTATPSLRT